MGWKAPLAGLGVRSLCSSSPTAGPGAPFLILLLPSVSNVENHLVLQLVPNSFNCLLGSL